MSIVERNGGWYIKLEPLFVISDKIHVPHSIDVTSQNGAEHEWF